MLLNHMNTHLPVGGVFRAGGVHTHDNEDMLEVRADVLRSERQSSWLLKDDGDNVVSYVPLPQELETRGDKCLLAPTFILTQPMTQCLATQRSHRDIFYKTPNNSSLCFCVLSTQCGIFVSVRVMVCPSLCEHRER